LATTGTPRAPAGGRRTSSVIPVTIDPLPESRDRKLGSPKTGFSRLHAPGRHRVRSVVVTAPTVEIHLFAAARAAVGQSTVSLAPGTLTGLLDALEGAHPDFARVRPQCSYLIDGIPPHGDPAVVLLPAGSRLDVLPPFAGG